jgi:hypothetical protein
MRIADAETTNEAATNCASHYARCLHHFDRGRDACAADHQVNVKRDDFRPQLKRSATARRAVMRIGEFRMGYFETPA